MSTKLAEEIVFAPPDLEQNIAVAVETLQARHSATEIPETDILNFALNL